MLQIETKGRRHPKTSRFVTSGADIAVLALQIETNRRGGLRCPAQAAAKEKVDFQACPKNLPLWLAHQVDDVKAGVALGDDVAAAKDAGGRLGCDARHIGAE